MIFNLIRKAKEVIYKNGQNVEEALDEINSNLTATILYKGVKTYEINDIPNLADYKRLDVVVQNASYTFYKTETIYPEITGMVATSVTHSYMAYDGTHQFASGDIIVDTANNRIYMGNKRGMIMNVTTSKTITHMSQGAGI